MGSLVSTTALSDVVGLLYSSRGTTGCDLGYGVIVVQSSPRQPSIDPEPSISENRSQANDSSSATY